MEKKVFFKNNKNQRLAGILHIPTGKGPFPAVIICHGLSSSKDSKYRKRICNDLTKNKIIALRFDFAGHGESQGKFENVTVSQAVKDIEFAFKHVMKDKRVDIKRLGLSGVSHGGVSSEIAAAKNKYVKALVLYAPATDYPNIRLYSLGKIGLENWSKRGYFFYKPDLKINYSFYLDSKKNVGYDYAKRIKAKTLVIHGVKDDLVPVAMSKKFYRLLKCYKKLILISSADHKLRDKPWEGRVVKLTVNWFKKYL